MFQNLNFFLHFTTTDPLYSNYKQHYLTLEKTENDWLPHQITILFNTDPSSFTNVHR